MDYSWKPAKEGEDETEEKAPHSASQKDREGRKDDTEKKEHASDLGLDFHPIIFDHGIA